MSQRVYKYALSYQRPVTDLDMPDGAEAISVGDQVGSPVLWALVDTDAPLVRRRFITIFTGEPAPIPAAMLRADQHVGTVQIGPIVLHVFDVGLAP